MKIKTNNSKSNLRKIIAFFVLGNSLIFPNMEVFANVYVKGYYRSNGTYVDPHYRTSPNSTISDNYSTWGNSNPYTGQKGYYRGY